MGFAPPTGGRMSYTGNVEPGGRPDVRELPGLTVTKVSVGPMDNNAYMLRCTATGERLLIDAANEAARLLEPSATAASSASSPPIAPGPLGGARRGGRATGAPVLAHADDAEALPVPVAEPVDDGDIVRVGGVAGGHPPRGHTPGSVALLLRGRTRRAPAPVHRRQPVPRRRRQDLGDPTRFNSLLADVEESFSTGCPTTPRLPRPRQGLDARPRAARAPRMAGPRLVIPRPGRNRPR